MKKMIAGLLGLVLSVTCALPVKAQNLQGRYDSYGIGGVSYSLNSGGAFYGQEFNSATAAQWSLGFGSSQSTAGTATLTWDKAGHTGLSGIGAPAVSSCGTGPSVAAGSDSAGDVTTGTTNSSACTLTFAAAYTVVPHCFCSDRTTKAPCIAQASLTTVALAGTTTNPWPSNDVIDYVCIGN